MKSKNEEIKEKVRKSYSRVAADVADSCGCSCKSSCCGVFSKADISKQIGYSKKDIDKFSEANMGLGCGNPTAFSRIKRGDVVLDLGSGAGFDAFLALDYVGENGKVIGVDMTEEMIKKSRQNAEKYGYKNIEFRLGDIENLPVEGKSIDVIISNCVINLAPDKDKVFSEAYRVLKKGGRIYISDIVLLGELKEKQKNNDSLLTGCVAGALQKEEYIKKIKQAGFKVRILGEDKGISKRQYDGIALESLKIEGIK